MHGGVSICEVSGVPVVEPDGVCDQKQDGCYYNEKFELRVGGVAGVEGPQVLDSALNDLFRAKRGEYRREHFGSAIGGL